MGCDGVDRPPPVELTRLAIDAINPRDERYRITTARALDPLIASIRRVGLLVPPLVRPEDEGLAVVSGFRRIEACRRLGWERLAVRLHSARRDRYDAARCAVGENSTARTLDPIETGRALRLLESHAPHGAVPAEDLAALGLPANPEIGARLKALAALPESVQDGVVEGSIPLAAAFELGAMEPSAAAAMADLLRPLRASLNRQREIITLAAEIARRDGIPLVEFLKDPGLRGVLDRPKADRNQRARALREWLRRRRYPVLSTAERNFEAIRQRLAPGAEIKLAAPRDFEGTAFVLEVTIDGPESLERQRERVNALFDHPDFRRLLSGKAGCFEEGA
jgi:ParB-like chromosome segregation protein Spo0J